jgi:hypothetical protein
MKIPYVPCDDCKKKACDNCAYKNLQINYQRALDEIRKEKAARGEPITILEH